MYERLYEAMRALPVYKSKQIYALKALFFAASDWANIKSELQIINSDFNAFRLLKL